MGWIRRKIRIGRRSFGDVIVTGPSASNITRMTGDRVVPAAPPAQRRGYWLRRRDATERRILVPGDRRVAPAQLDRRLQERPRSGVGDARLAPADRCEAHRFGSPAGSSVRSVMVVSGRWSSPVAGGRSSSHGDAEESTVTNDLAEVGSQAPRLRPRHPCHREDRSTNPQDDA